MGDPLKVCARGPLVPLIPVFREALFEGGYASDTVAQQLRLVAHLSWWLGARAMTVQDLSPSVIDRFVRDRRSTHVNLSGRRALVPFVGFLNSCGVERADDPVVPPPAWQQILDRFGCYLTCERALRATTVTNYLNQTRPFLRWRAQRGGDDVGTVTADEVTAFLVMRSVAQSRGSVRVAATALRALLNWMFLTGLTPTPLAGAIASVAYSSYAGLPKGLSAGQVQALTERARSSVLGPRRNLALMLVFSRLGLRAREAAGLLCADIHWRTGTVTVRGKGGRVQVMPLPVDVGAALADYLRNERPASASGQVFLRVLAPHSPMSAGGLSQVVTSLGKGAGIGARIGSHRLRHTAATAVLAHGGSLIEAAQLMRHADLTSTMIYAKVDLVALRTLARPWPGASETGSSTVGANAPGRSS